MDLLPELIKIIFDVLPVTDKRNYKRTCITSNKLINQTPINSKLQYIYNTFNGNLNILAKTTFEMLFDGYAHLIPQHYLILNNSALYHNNKIYYWCAKQGYLECLKLLMDCSFQFDFLHNEKYQYLFIGATKGGHLHILKWAIIMAYRWCCNGIIKEHEQLERNYESMNILSLDYGSFDYYSYEEDRNKVITNPKENKYYDSFPKEHWKQLPSIKEVNTQINNINKKYVYKNKNLIMTHVLRRYTKKELLICIKSFECFPPKTVLIAIARKHKYKDIETYLSQDYFDMLK